MKKTSNMLGTAQLSVIAVNDGEAEVKVLDITPDTKCRGVMGNIFTVDAKVPHLSVNIDHSGKGLEVRLRNEVLLENGDRICAYFSYDPETYEIRILGVLEDDEFVHEMRELDRRRKQSLGDKNVANAVTRSARPDQPSTEIMEEGHQLKNAFPPKVVTKVDDHRTTKRREQTAPRRDGKKSRPGDEDKRKQEETRANAA